jgi:hypothetical protein
MKAVLSATQLAPLIPLGSLTLPEHAPSFEHRGVAYDYRRSAMAPTTALATPRKLRAPRSLSTR